jgi:hypothetical protein
MSITCVRRHVDITGRNRRNIVPAANIALAVFIITRSRHRSVRFKADGMTAACGYGIWGAGALPGPDIIWFHGNSSLFIEG